VLQGTFDTLALPEVLGLLAHSRKTGALWLEAGPATAVVYIADGRCCASQSGDVTGAVTDGPSLLGRVVDFCFAAARTDDGAFRFGSEEPPWTCSETIDLDVAVDELARLLEEWTEIQSVIPTLDARVRLTEELGADELVVDRDRWRLVVAIDGRRTVRELVRKTNRPVLEVCHAVVALVEAGAVDVAQPPAPTTRSVSASKRPEPRSASAAVDPEVPWGPGVESPHPGPQPLLPPGNDRNAKKDYMGTFSGLRGS
jgi:hypothetical protein